MMNGADTVPGAATERDRMIFYIAKVGQHVPAALSAVGFFYAAESQLPPFLDGGTALFLAIVIGGVIYRIVLNATRRAEAVYLGIIDRLTARNSELETELAVARKLEHDFRDWDRRRRLDNGDEPPPIP